MFSIPFKWWAAWEDNTCLCFSGTSDQFHFFCLSHLLSWSVWSSCSQQQIKVTWRRSIDWFGSKMNFYTSVLFSSSASCPAASASSGSEERWTETFHPLHVNIYLYVQQEATVWHKPDTFCTFQPQSYNFYDKITKEILKLLFFIPKLICLNFYYWFFF